MTDKPAARICPRCGVGIDTDGGGNCATCAKYSDVEVATWERGDKPTAPQPSKRPVIDTLLGFIEGCCKCSTCAWNAKEVRKLLDEPAPALAAFKALAEKLLWAAEWAVYALEHGSSVEVHWLQAIAHENHKKAQDAIAEAKTLLAQKEGT